MEIITDDRVSSLIAQKELNDPDTIQSKITIVLSFPFRATSIKIGMENRAVKPTPNEVEICEKKSPSLFPRMPAIKAPNKGRKIIIASIRLTNP